MVLHASAGSLHIREVVPQPQVTSYHAMPDCWHVMICLQIPRKRLEEHLEEKSYDRQAHEMGDVQQYRATPVPAPAQHQGSSAAFDLHILVVGLLLNY
jgi:hypothetical protein